MADPDRALPYPYVTARPAQMGNLNKDSTHPNPWYPPTEYERMRGFCVPYRIYHNPKDPIGPIKPLKNFLEEDGFISNCGWAAWKGLFIGSLFAANDIIVVNNIDAPKARFARCCYVIPPYVGMAVSFVAAREALGNISREKNAPWTYPAAVLAPASIWGIFRNGLDHGIRFAVFGGIVAAVYKWNIDHGGMLLPKGSSFSAQPFYQIWGNKYQDYDHEKGDHRPQSFWGQGWRGWPFKVEDYNNWWTPREEPTWKKHVSPEEAEKGPPTNL